MTEEASIESLFKQHSFEEIESVRDNLANEIEKRTELLKSIVKEKYRDIVETSDAIQSMKLNLKQVEQSLWSLDKCILDFYSRVKEPELFSSENKSIQYKNETSNDEFESCCNVTSEDDMVKKLVNCSSELWDNFDRADLKRSVELLNELTNMLESNQHLSHQKIFDNFKLTTERAREIIKNSLWHNIQSAAPDQLGIITGSEQDDLYLLSLTSSIEFLVDVLSRDLSDTSYQAQIKRYQPLSYFDPQKNEIEASAKDTMNLKTSCLPIPKLISPELNAFLYGVCKVINTIAGFNLSRSAIVMSLEISIEEILKVYAAIIPLINVLMAETKRKRALQLYFDLLYVRILLNTSKSLDLIEKLDPKITELANQFELMLDTIELYTISAALHSNVTALSQSTIRLYGLLIPHLQ